MENHSQGSNVLSNELRIIQALRRIIRSTEIHSRQLALQWKVTAPQLICLRAIAQHGPLTGSKLAQQVHLSPSTIVGILDRLEEKHLVTKTRAVDDRRTIHVSLTSQGEKLVAEAPSPLQGKLFAALNRLVPADQAIIAESLERVVEMMEAHNVEAAPILETGPIDQSAEGKILPSEVEELV
ncbi:MAG: MarR family transcriptional regulator [Bdellovibrionales bacterium]|nr:MarR family transcriptional regulator [Bdellovibrionales bacterium]